jgi:hypothetical protein
VLLGVKEPSDSYNNYAFFFIDGRYLGTDASHPSARLQFDSQTDDTVTLQYSLYQPGDSMPNPSGGRATVRYQWTGSKLVPLDPIPTDDWSAPMSRR